MSEVAFCLSKQLPEFLRSDLATAPGASLVKALDGFLSEIGHLACLRSFEDMGGGLSPDAMDRVLLALGFHFQSLDRPARRLLYVRRNALMASRHWLAGVRALAELYCPGSSVQYGLPYAGLRLGQKAGGHLLNVDGSDPTIFVRLATPEADGKADDLERTLRCLFSSSCQYWVVPACQPVQIDRSAHIGNARSWNGRRL